jgi:tetratricopeptide (TPR) repeat protein
VRITVQLIDGETDRHLWAESFERELSMQSIFLIQAEVADQIAKALRLENRALPPAIRSEMPTTSLEAYDAFLLGRYHTFRQTPEDLALAVNLLKAAILLDPEFTDAYTALGWAYSFLGTTYGQQLPADVYPKARQAALTALSLDSQLANARGLYADILTWYDWDFVAAEREYRKTAELDPLNVLGYALFLTIQQRHDEAISMIETRLRASPGDPYVHVNAAWRYYSARHYDRAIQEATLASSHADARSVLGFAYLEMGNVQVAIELFELDARERRSSPQALSNLAYAYFRTGQFPEGEAALVSLLSLAESEFVSPATIAPVYFAANRADEGFALLQQAVAIRAREMIFMQVDHTFDDYRKDPRYLELIRMVGFQKRNPTLTD